MSASSLRFVLFAVAFGGLASCDAFGADEGTSGSTSNPACNGRPDCERVIFVTSKRWSGDLGGLAGGDKACNDAATAGRSANVRGRTYKAWLSNGASSASARLTHGTSRYLSTAGRVVANDFNDLTTSGFESPPSDENGDPAGGSVWTASLATGTYTPSASSCTQWTNASAQVAGVFGQVDAKDATTWSVSGQQPCDTLAHLYCLED